MADCSYYRCIQERRFVKRELQKWSKDMVYIVGECLPFIYIRFSLGWNFSNWTRFFHNPLHPHQLLLFRNYFSLFSSFIRLFQPQPRMLWKLFCRLCLMLDSKQKPVAEKTTILPNFKAKSMKHKTLTKHRLAFVFCRLLNFETILIRLSLLFY